MLVTGLQYRFNKLQVTSKDLLVKECFRHFCGVLITLFDLVEVWFQNAMFKTCNFIFFHYRDYVISLLEVFSLGCPLFKCTFKDFTYEDTQQAVSI